MKGAWQGYRALVVGAALALLGAACGAPSAQQPAPLPASGAPGSGHPSAAVAAPAEPERVRLSYAAISTSFATAWVAKDAGIFARHGFEAEVRPKTCAASAWRSPSSAPRPISWRAIYSSSGGCGPTRM
jgi:hypothetical protein